MTGKLRETTVMIGRARGLNPMDANKLSIGTRALLAELDRNVAPLEPIRPSRSCRHEASEGRSGCGF